MKHRSECLNGPSTTAAQPNATPLAADVIAASLRHAINCECEVEVVSVTGSTNEDLVVRARAQQPSGFVLRTADFQTAGRGRHQRVWHARPGQSLLFSLAIPAAGMVQPMPAITLACGVALAACLAQSNVAVQLKWPNDLRVDGRKLAGILTELVSDRAGRHTLVIGIGVNLHLDRATRDAIGTPAVALDELTQAELLQSREQWLGRLGGAVIGAATRFAHDGFESFRSEFNRLLESRGEIVDVLASDSSAGAAISGRVIGVDHDGRLVIDSEGRPVSIAAGDVVRR